MNKPFRKIKGKAKDAGEDIRNSKSNRFRFMFKSGVQVVLGIFTSRDSFAALTTVILPH